MKILITNDDGIHAAGLRILAETVQNFGTVKVFVPEKERSACGHSMSLHEPMRCQKIAWNGIETYITNASPADCVNLGLAIGWPDGCDVVLSGINNGPNLGLDLTYSGTVAGAMEGAIHGIRSIALSMAFMDARSDHFFETGSQWLSENWEALMNQPNPAPSFLNVNIPAIPFSVLKGNQITKMGPRLYEGQLEQREDPYGRSYWWYHGDFGCEVENSGSDVDAVRSGYVSISPLSLDWTDHKLFEELSQNLSPFDKSSTRSTFTQA